VIYTTTNIMPLYNDQFISQILTLRGYCERREVRRNPRRNRIRSEIQSQNLFRALSNKGGEAFGDVNGEEALDMLED
jgi:hypothetical protein